MATHTKFGYNLTKNNNYSGYKHISIHILYQDNYDEWRNLCTIAFQGNKDEDFTWYGYQMSMAYSLYNTDFSAFVKFAQKVERANLHNTSLGEVMQFLADNKLRRVVYDSRLNRYVEFGDYVNSADMRVFRLHFHGQYIDNCLAYSESQAETYFLSKIANQDYYNWREMIKNWSDAVISEHHAREITYAPEINDWMK